MWKSKQFSGIGNYLDSFSISAIGALFMIPVSTRMAHFWTSPSGSSASATDTEAEIYAQAMTALQFAYLNEDQQALEDEDYYDKVMVEVFLHILRLEKDNALRKVIFCRLPGEL